MTSLTVGDKNRPGKPRERGEDHQKQAKLVQRLGDSLSRFSHPAHFPSPYAPQGPGGEPDGTRSETDGDPTLREKRPGEDVERLTVERSETGDHDTADQGKELMNGGFYYGFYGSLFTS